MKRLLPSLLLCLITVSALYLPSCVTTSASLGAKSIKAPYASSLRNAKTYAWYQQSPPAKPEYLQGYKPSLHEHAVAAVERTLQERGFTKVDKNPDVLVAYDVSVSVPVEKDNPENFAEGFGYSYAFMSGYRYTYGHADMPGYRNVDLFKEGTLIIDLINPKSNMLLWRGWAESAVNPKSRAGAVAKKVEEVMAQF